MVTQVKSIRIPEQKEFEDGSVFPKIYANTDPACTTRESLVNWATQNAAELAQELKAECAILFRGFPIRSAEDFQAFVDALGVKSLPYVGGAAVRYHTS